MNTKNKVGRSILNCPVDKEKRMLSCQTTNLITVPYKYKNIHHKLQFTKAASPVEEKPFNDHIQMGMVCCHSKLSSQAEALFCLLDSTFSSHSVRAEKFQSFQTVLSKHSSKMTVIYHLTILLTQTHTAWYYELCTGKTLSGTPSLHWLQGFLLLFGLISLHADWRNVWKHIYPAVLYGNVSYAFNIKSKIVFELTVIDFLCPTQIFKILSTLKYKPMRKWKLVKCRDKTNFNIFLTMIDRKSVV